MIVALVAISGVTLIVVLSVGILGIKRIKQLSVVYSQLQDETTKTLNDVKDTISILHNENQEFQEKWNSHIKSEDEVRLAMQEQIKSLNIKIAEAENSTKSRIDEMNRLFNLAQVTFTAKVEQVYAAVLTKANRLDVEYSHWTLENNNVKKVFVPGRIEKVEMPSDNTEMEYHYLEDNTILCTTKVNDLLKSKVILSQYGAPIKGEIYDADGNILSIYQYDQLGQVSEISDK